jgi:hypothetical protein
MSLSDQIQTDLVAAMRSKDAFGLGALRMIKAALKNKEVEKRAPLSDDEGRAVLETLVKQRREAAVQFREGGRAELADKEEREMALIGEYLPSAASEEDISRAIDEAIARTGATGIRDMGKAMKAVTALLSSKTVDRGRVSALVKEALESQ